MIFKIARINHDYQPVGTPFTGLHPHHNVARDLFIRAGGFKAICARQINQFNRAAIGQDQPSGMAFNRNAGIIARFLARARQRVEECRFASVGIADQRDERGWVHKGATVTAAA